MLPILQAGHHNAGGSTIPARSKRQTENLSDPSAYSAHIAAFSGFRQCKLCNHNQSATQTPKTPISITPTSITSRNTHKYQPPSAIEIPSQHMQFAIYARLCYSVV